MKTQKQIVLEHLRNNITISSYEAFSLYDITRLGARIHELKHDGHLITKVLVTKNKKTFAKYFLKEKK